MSHDLPDNYLELISPYTEFEDYSGDGQSVIADLVPVPSYVSSVAACLAGEALNLASQTGWKVFIQAGSRRAFPIRLADGGEPVSVGVESGPVVDRALTELGKFKTKMPDFSDADVRLLLVAPLRAWFLWIVALPGTDGGLLVPLNRSVLGPEHQPVHGTAEFESLVQARTEEEVERMEAMAVADK